MEVGVATSLLTQNVRGDASANPFPMSCVYPGLVGGARTLPTTDPCGLGTSICVAFAVFLAAAHAGRRHELGARATNATTTTRATNATNQSARGVASAYDRRPVASHKIVHSVSRWRRFGVREAAGRPDTYRPFSVAA